MDRKSVWAFILIGLLLVAFSMYNSKVSRKAEREAFVADSIAKAEALAKARQDSLNGLNATITEGVDSSSAISDTLVATPKMFSNDALNNAMSGEESIAYLENDVLRIAFSNKGAKPYTANIKQYNAYGGGSLLLFSGSGTTMALSLTIGQQYVSTSELYFSIVSSTKDKLVYRLELDSLSHIDYIYTLQPNSYLMDFDIQMEGMENYIPKNTTQIALDWAVDIRRQEKGYDNEKNYSSMSFKYPDSEKVENFGQRKPKAEKDVTTKFQWVAFQQQFFSTILIAKDNFSGGKLNMEFYPEADEHKKLMRCGASVQIPFDGFNPSKNIGLQLYIGPNKFKILESYNLGFEKIVPLGGRLVSWINRWIIIPTFDFMSKYIANYGLIILLLTILLKLVTSPLLIKSYKSSAKMRILKPEIEKINEKYSKKSDEMKKQQATMDLYRRGDVSMMGGCLPVLFQMPVLFAMFRFFPVSFELRQQSFLWAEDLSGYDSILDLPFKIPMYGDHISLFGLMVAVTMYFYSKTSMDSSPNQMPGMKGMMLYFMPIMMLIFCNNFSSALCYYYLITNLITILLTWLVRKYGVDADKLLKMVHDRENEPPKKSKWQLRLEEMQKMQQKQMAQRKKR